VYGARADPSRVGAAASPDSHWLDVREFSHLSEALSDRLALCAAKGFDGVVLANLDGYARPTGFPITAAEQLRFNTALVALGHSYGLVVAVAANPRTPVPVEADIVVTEPRCVEPRDEDSPQKTVRLGAVGAAAGTWGMSTTSGS
jgi:hypothetical protein